jgi:hypothetical protein
MLNYPAVPENFLRNFLGLWRSDMLYEAFLSRSELLEISSGIRKAKFAVWAAPDFIWISIFPIIFPKANRADVVATIFAHRQITANLAWNRFFVTHFYFITPTNNNCYLVGHKDRAWNPIFASMQLIYEKLVNIPDCANRCREASNDSRSPDTQRGHHHLPKKPEGPLAFQ